MSINKGNKKCKHFINISSAIMVFYFYFVVLFYIKRTGLCEFFLGVNPACTYIYSLDWVIWNWNIWNTLPYWDISNFNTWTSVSPSLIKFDSKISAFITTLKKRWTPWWRSLWVLLSDSWPAALLGTRMDLAGKARACAGRAPPAATVRQPMTRPG